jgi:uncharacterized membrane protein YeiH
MYNKSIDVENYRKKEGLDLQTMLMIFDILGTVAFAVSGALVAIKRRMDIFGVAVLAIVTATGGGILRDVLIGRLPPDALLYPRYVAIAAGVGLLGFLVMYFHPRMPEKLTTAYDMMMFIFDTLGVAAFTVDGVAVEAVEAGAGVYYIEKAHIGTQNLATAVVFGIGDYTYTASPMSYVYTVNEAAESDVITAELKDACAALYYYYAAVAKYFNLGVDNTGFTTSNTLRILSDVANAFSAPRFIKVA